MSTPDQTTPACVAAYNPVDPKELEDPFPSYNELRRAAPVFYNAQFDSWMVMRPEDILTMQRDTASFSSKSIMSPQHPLPPEVVAVLGSDEIKLPTLLTTDPPDHARLRSLLNKGFSAQSIAAREPAVRAVADELIDSFVGDGHAELMSQFAFPFTAIVIGDMLGVPRADNAQLKRWSDDWMTLIFALAPVEQLVEAAHGLMAFQRYFAEVMAERRAHPGDDVLSILIQAQLDDGDRLSQEELIAVPMQLIVGGHETTYFSIGNALALLLQHPDDLQALRDDWSLLPQAIEETIRYHSPLITGRRQTTREVTLGGVTIPADRAVQPMRAAANRDETLFPDPDRFDIRRANADRHTSFGRGGIHVCLGLALARMELRVALERLLTRLPNLRFQPNDPPQRAHALGFFGFKRLPLAWDAPGVA